jgi:hypothetical protein
MLDLLLRGVAADAAGAINRNLPPYDSSEQFANGFGRDLAEEVEDGDLQTCNGNPKWKALPFIVLIR